MKKTDHDVVIIGGGLAGLSLALQLRNEQPDIGVAVLERKEHPVPLAAHKVGESTVEIGARYLAKGAGLEDHLKNDHLRKHGLRFFFGGEKNGFHDADELGAGELLPTASYQVDRGLLENEMGERARAAGVQFIDGVRVTGIDLDEPHRVRYRNGADGTLSGRWVVDAASRASPLKRHLGVARPNNHNCNAVWWRIGERVKIDDWSNDGDWLARNRALPRWHSTNHLMGAGYWVWLIPLSSGATSIGIVADPRLHPLDELKSLDKAMAWLHRHEPRCAAALEGLEVLDFAFLKHFSHDCQQVYGKERWALTGEAGVFLDPFYSPGSDFIGISNTFVSDLIARERAGEDIRGRSLVLQQLYLSFYASTLLLYEDLYPGFGDRHLMVLKTVWDYCYYWAVLALLFYNDALTDDAMIARYTDPLVSIQKRNREVQGAFRDRAAQSIVMPGEGRYFDQAAMPLMVRLNAELQDDLDADALAARLATNLEMLETLADTILLRLREPDAPVSEFERETLGDLAERLTG